MVMTTLTAKIAQASGELSTSAQTEHAAEHEDQPGKDRDDDADQADEDEQWRDERAQRVGHGVHVRGCCRRPRAP